MHRHNSLPSNKHHAWSTEARFKSDLSGTKRFQVFPACPSSRKNTFTKSIRQTSFLSNVIRDDDGVDDDEEEEEEDTLSSFTSSTDESLKRLKQKLLMESTIRADDSSDSEIMSHLDISDVTYSSDEEPKTERQVKKYDTKFTCDGSGPVTCIAPVDEDQAWICRGNGRVVSLYHKNGHKKILRTLTTKVEDMCLRQDGTVVLVPHQSQKIKTMSKTGRLTDFTSFELTVAGVCSTSRNEILASSYIPVVAKKQPRPRNKPEIIRLAYNGEQIWRIRPKGTDVFAKLSRIAASNHGDICVIDLGRRHVVITTPDGAVKGKYYGIKDAVLPKPFDPKDVCYDSHGFIYVADFCNSAVHVLDKNGTFQRFLLTQHDGIAYPSALATCSSGSIWVGFASGDVRTYLLDTTNK